MRKKRTISKKEKDEVGKQTLISSFMCPPEKLQDQKYPNNEGSQDEKKEVSK